MDRLAALKTFVLVADHRSFAEAARRLRVSPTAASRAVAALEHDLGVTLVRRTTRSVRLTPEGESYVERCRRVLDDLDDAERSLRGEDAAPRGALAIAAPVVFGRMHVLPIITDLLRAHAALHVRLTLNDRLVRLVEEGIDVALRIGDLADSTLHALRVAEVRRVLVASPAYLEARGAPADVAALAAHDLVVFESFAQNGEWRFGPDAGPPLRANPRLLTDSVESAIDAAIAGVGITRVLSYQVQAHVQAGRLRYVLEGAEPPPAPVSLVFQANRRRAPNVAAFVAAAQEYCRGRDFA